MSDEVETPPDQLIHQIRFGLQDLTARNGHHEFEEACQHLARARIASNILPATGPVSSGGDQGRDFETFRSYLREELGDRGWFAGLVSDGPLAFLCTLQQGSLSGKIKNDVAKVVGSGSSVERIYAFCTADISVAQRHKIAHDVRVEHAVELEIWDGRAIADHLADHDTFWIASRYLSLPSELAPARPSSERGVPQWYEDLRGRWRDRGPPRPLLAELLEIKSALRHAAFSGSARGDLSFWLELMRRFLTDESPQEIVQRARYEIAVASMRGLGHLRDADPLISAFLSDSTGDDDPARLQDAAVLVSIATTASAVGHSHLEPKELSTRRAELRSRVGELLDQSPPKGRRARLLQVKGHLALIPEPTELPRRAPTDPVPFADWPHDTVAPPEAAKLYAAGDVDEAAAAWSDLASSLAETPLFPVDEFATLLRFLTPVLVDQPQWDSMVEAVDAAVARSSGGAAAGAGCRDRAMALLDAGRLRKALHEMHRAKEEWWGGETLRGALLAMLLISDAYHRLGLPFAAKQHALAVTGAAEAQGDDELQDLVAAGLLHAAQCSYLAGDWMAAVEELEAGLLALHVLNDEDDPRAGELLQNAVLAYGMCLRAAKDLVPDVVPVLTEIGDRFGIREGVEDALEGADSWSRDDWKRLADEQLAGRPFSDLGENYEIRFAALGTCWTLRTPNEYVAVRAAQRLAAAAQILLVELAEDDLCLMPSTIDVQVELLDAQSGGGPERVEARPSNEGREWIVRLSPARPGVALDEQDNFVELLSVLSMLMLDVSLLPSPQYFAAIERAFERGLGHKLASGRPYDEMAEVIPEDRWRASKRAALKPPFDSRSTPPKEHTELAWQNGPGPTFSREKAEEMAATRYVRIPEVLCKTLPQLRRDAAFLGVVAELRSRGWLDWHILTAAFNAAGNVRMQRAGMATRDGLIKAGGPRAVERLMTTPEQPDEPDIPLDVFTLDAMEFHREGAVPSLLANWDLEPRQETPDIAATQRVLDQRYGYWDIDAPHRDFFPAAQLRSANQGSTTGDVGSRLPFRA
jgi:hypothetical protein